MSKKVLLFVYSKLNLGDNLFVYTLSKKYPNIDFYLHSTDEEYRQVFEKYPNVKIINQGRLVDNVDIDNFDSFIYIGGSIFIESEYSFGELKEFQKFIKRCKEKNKKFFYMSCNFGPYQTQEYLNIARENFKLCDGICFRDLKSYNLFKDIKNVYYGPDVIFSLDAEKTKKERKSLGISVIDLSIRKDLQSKQGEYENFIKKIIKKYAKWNYKIYLFSFCEFEHDETAIERIVNNLTPKEKEKIKVVKYKNSIEEFLKVYSKMKYMVATRFHSMILSIIYHQKIYNVTYSQKQDCVIEDLKLFKNYQRIKDLTYDTAIKIYQFKKVPKEQIEQIKLQTKEQLKLIEDINNIDF